MAHPVDRDVTERLRRLARYGAGWDGYRAEPASPAAVELACAFVATLGGALDLEAGLEPDGTVDLRYDLGGETVVLGFTPEGQVDVHRRSAGTWVDAGSYDLLKMGGRVRIPSALRAILVADAPVTDVPAGCLETGSVQQDQPNA